MYGFDVVFLYAHLDATAITFLSREQDVGRAD